MQIGNSWITVALVLAVLTLNLGSCAISSNPIPSDQSTASPSTAIRAPRRQAIAPPTATPAVSPAASPETDIATTANAEIWARLRADVGFVVLLRHAQTVPGTGDPPGFRLDDCATQRNLSAGGKLQAGRIGQAFERENINVVQVLSSQYCRCLATAELMDVGPVTSAPSLNSIFEDRSTADAQIEQTQEYVLNHRGQAGVIVMVTHSANISALSGISPQPGDAIILRANEQGTIDVAGQLRGL
jgi:phosphohistidine phosphatase SixA